MELRDAVARRRMTRIFSAAPLQPGVVDGLLAAALRAFPLLGVVGARLPPLWFEVVLGLSALCMAALGVMAMGGPLWTP